MSQQYPGFDPTQPPRQPQPSGVPQPYGVPQPQAFPGATQYDPAAPQPNYAAPTPYGFDSRPEHPDSTLVLVLGVVSLFAGVTGPFAWYYGNRARKQLQADPYRWSQSTGLTVGWVLGIITTIGLIVGTLLVIAWFVLIIGVSVAGR